MARTTHLLRLAAVSGAFAFALTRPAMAQEPPVSDEPQPPETPAEPETTVPETTEPPVVTVPETPEVTTPPEVPDPEPPVVPDVVVNSPDQVVLPDALAQVEAPEAPAAPEDPPGNNGTVKVDGVEFDSHPDNQPHVGCVFQIDFYGFDEGDLTATVDFEGVPPTGGGPLLSDVVDIGEDPAGGGTDLDASVTYDLSAALAGITPHPIQGHHVKLTIDAEGSQGSGTKHKTFWVEGCSTPTTTTTVPETTTTVPEETTTVPPTSAPPSTQPPEVTLAPPALELPQPLQHEAAAPSTTETTAENLPRTGSDITSLVLSGLVLVGLGVAGVWLGRIRRPAD
jgi:LPXTG-motif cell wall-anchored protein